MDVIDLRRHGEYLPQYVELRNRYSDLLLTRPVTLEETREWLEREPVEVRCVVDHDLLLGVAVLYLGRKGEVAFFVREPGKGIGSMLLAEIERVASKKKVGRLWAWVLPSNVPAQRAFVKSGYVKEAGKEKSHGGKTYPGLVFGKSIG